jgi:hypothetical protein
MIVFADERNSWSLSLRNVLHSPVTLSLHDTNIILRTISTDILNPYSSHGAKHHVSATYLLAHLGRAIAQAVIRRLPNARGPGSRPGHVGFVVDKVALG